MEEEEVYLTTKEATALLGVSRQFLLKLRKEGKLDTYHKGEGTKNIRYSASNIEAFLLGHNKITKQPTPITGDVQ